MTDVFLAEQVKVMASIIDIGVRRPLREIEGPIHPQGTAAHDLALAEKWLREAADEVKQARERVTKLREVA